MVGANVLLYGREDGGWLEDVLMMSLGFPTGWAESGVNGIIRNSILVCNKAVVVVYSIRRLSTNTALYHMQHITLDEQSYIGSAHWLLHRQEKCAATE